MDAVNESGKSGLKVKIISVNSWFDLMPVVEGEKKNNFHFSVEGSVFYNNIAKYIKNNQLKIDRFEIKFNNCSVYNKKFSLEINDIAKDSVEFKIKSTPDENYINEIYEMPQSVSFSFDVIFKKQRKQIETANINIKKVY